MSAAHSRIHFRYTFHPDVLSMSLSLFLYLKNVLILITLNVVLFVPRLILHVIYIYFKCGAYFSPWDFFPHKVGDFQKGAS